MIKSFAGSELESELELCPNDKFELGETSELGGELPPRGIPPGWLSGCVGLGVEEDDVPELVDDEVDPARFAATLGLTSELSPLRAEAVLGSICG
jgi:hypothetical protein